MLFIRVLLPPPIHNPRKSKEVEKPVRNSGFFLAICPKTCYTIHQNPAVLGADYPTKAPKENEKPPKHGGLIYAKKNNTPF